MRFIIAVILGGIMLFGWGTVSHILLGLQDKTIKSVPNEAAVMSALKTNITDPGFYFMPGIDMTKTPTFEEQAVWMQKYADGPTAIVVYQPAGEIAMSPKRFGTQFGTNLAVALVIGIILAFASVGFARGVIITTLIGVAGWVAILVPYWNWYRFPNEFVAASLVDQAAGFFLAGLVMAFILKKRTAVSEPSPPAARPVVPAEPPAATPEA